MANVTYWGTEANSYLCAVPAHIREAVETRLSPTRADSASPSASKASLDFSMSTPDLTGTTDKHVRGGTALWWDRGIAATDILNVDGIAEQLCDTKNWTACVLETAHLTFLIDFIL